MKSKQLSGRFGEALAAEHYRKKGYVIVGMNYRTRFGELDVIAENRRYLVFAEVKLRKDSSHGEAREFVTASKQRKLILAAESYLQGCPTEKQPRFDVVEIYAPEGAAGETRVNIIENAFEAG